jgi:O-antigen polymerase
MKSIPVSSILYFLLSLGVLFVNANTFTDSQIFPKWIFMFAGLGVIGCLFSFYLFLGKRFVCNAKCCYYTVIISCFLQAGYGILQFFNILSSHSITYNVVGSFDNPAGFAGSLCAGLPFTFYFLQYSNKKVQWASWCALFVIVLGVLLSESRAGSISIFTVLVIYFIHQNKNKFHYKKHIGSFLLCLSFLLISIFVISVTVYHLKKDSADGRLLIWRCTWEMIKHEPFTGYGVGGFSAHYMDYQAQYFKEHPDSQFAILADNIKSPFNEYLSVGVQFGILTWVLLIAAGIFLILCHRKHPTKAGYVSLLSLLSIAVFSFFLLSIHLSLHLDY